MQGVVRARRGAIALAAPVALLVLAAPAHAAKTVTKGVPANPGSLGDIPDNSPFNQSCAGDPLDVTFDVEGLAQPVADVRVTISAYHGQVGHLIATLLSPGGSAAHSLFNRTGRPPWSNGYYSGIGSVAGGRAPATYTFADHATGNWWAAADTEGIGAHAIPPGSYRATGPLSPAPTLITPSFAGVDVNGTWALQFEDCGQPTSGYVSSGALTITAAEDECPSATKKLEKAKKKKKQACS